MTYERTRNRPFNSALETGLRSVSLLVAAYPQTFDLQRLVTFDHLVVHTGDVGGPTSLHAAVPMRAAELLVRRGLVERGLLLMVGKGLAERNVEQTGIVYNAGEFAETFLSSLTSTYVRTLTERAEWVVQEFGNLTDRELKTRIGEYFDDWIEQFQAPHQSMVGDQ
ncbi:ABC-three component system middle component 2 [Thalassobaculum salexigens]|uniref:ABC-three component system middle component 2 n=1 Tax=Thalassobaculum salexigens TaxID=455360 RepID=UPI000A055C9F|nr:ABC-three component system middle component 2 [Thalassobaculum salexigens]